MACLLLLPVTAFAQSMTFSVLGDTPYDDDELVAFQENMLDHNLYSPADFLVHVGDIFGGGTPCDEYRYEQVADALRTLSVPAFIVPGDNETKDCDDQALGWTYWRTHYQGIDQDFCGTPPVQRQASRPENFAFVSKGVLFIGLHLLGGSGSTDLQQDDADWVEQHLLAQAPFVRAAVIFSHTGPNHGSSLFFDQFLQDALAFAKPILYVHGHGHSWIDDMPFGVASIRRIQVKSGDDPPVAITVTMDAPARFTVDRTPFDGSPRNAPPCVDAGPDLWIGSGQQAWLRGVADDDRDPGSSSLSLTWSKVSGPGTVSFSSPNSAETFASFGSNGTYSLRLRGSDGVLSATDLVTVSVSDGVPNDPPLASNDSYSIPMGQTLQVPAPGVLANDSDPNGTALSALLAASPAHGTLTLQANGSFTYVPAPGFHGLDSFTYRASDGLLQSAIAGVSLNVVPLTLTLFPQDDTMSESSDPDGASGSSSRLRVEVDDSSYRSFLRFQVEGTGTPILSAKLRLFVVNGGPDGGALHWISNYFPGTTTAWTEDTLTWNNAPPLTGTPLATAGEVDEGEWVEFDVSQAIRGDGTYSFGIQNASSNRVEYSSKEGSETPVLLIETLPGGGGQNGIPQAADNTYSLDEDASLTLAAPGVLANDGDPDGDSLRVILTVPPAMGSLSLDPAGGFTYTPQSNVNGTDTFTYVADDNRGGLEPASVTLQIRPVNDFPLANAESFALDEDVPLDVPAPGVLQNDTDLDGDALSASLSIPPTQGSLALRPDGGFLYTPNPDQNGQDQFTYTVSDGQGGTGTATVTLDVRSVADPPRATDDVYSGDEDVPLIVSGPGVLQNDTDAEGDSLSVRLESDASHGSVLLAADGSFTYSPAPDFNGTDAFTYRVTDAPGGSSTATVTLHVAPRNDAPRAYPDDLVTDEDVPLSLAAPGILENDTDIDGDGLSATLVDPPARGALALAPNGGLTYTPSDNEHGVDTFRYRVADGNGGSDTTTVVLTVRPVNDVPVAAADDYTVFEDTPLTATAPGFLENDTDADGDLLTATLLAPPAHGSLQWMPDGGFTYTPGTDFHGADSFTYEVADGQGGKAPAEVRLTVLPVNDVPVASNDTYELDEDNDLSVDVPGLQENDVDVDGDSLSVRVATPPTRGQILLGPRGDFLYTPDPNVHGTDSFTYSLSDPTGARSDATVSLLIRPVNDVPQVGDDSYVLSEDTELVVPSPGLLGNDADVDGDALTVSLLEAPENGALDLQPDGAFRYTPNPHFHGADAFTVRVTDGQGGFVTGNVVLQVEGVNDPPTSGADAYELDEDMPLTVPAPGVLGNDGDVDGDALSVVLVTPPQHGSVALAPNGRFTYTPSTDYFGTDAFAYRVQDPSLASALGTVTLSIRPVNDDPVGKVDGYSTPEDVPLVVAAPGVLANDIDVEGETLVASLESPPTHGLLTLRVDGSFDYTPAENFHGTDFFTYAVNDPAGATSSATVNLVVDSRNDDPVASDATHETDEDVALHVAAPGILGNVFDVDGDPLALSLVLSPSHGSLELQTDGSFLYTPQPDFHGLDAFTYRVTDPSGRSDAGTVVLRVRSINDAPLNGPDTYDVLEDDELFVPDPGILENDRDVDGDPLTAVLVASPSHGSLSLNSAGGFTYIPDPDFHGEDAFTVRVTDGQGGEAPGTVVIRVASVNDLPSVQDDAYTLDEDESLPVAAPGLLANDSDVDGDALTVRLLQAPTQGSLQLAANGSFNYTPALDVHGADAFTYEVLDGQGGRVQGTATLTILPVNDPPRVSGESFATLEDSPLVLAAPGVLSNDSDVDGDALTVAVASPPSHGTLVLFADGRFTFQPDPEFHGEDRFSYTVSDGNGGVAAGTSTIEVTSVNDSPQVQDDAFTVDEDRTLEVAAPGLLANDTDVDGDALTARLLLAPTEGSLQLSPNGSFRYTPALDFNGSDRFTYEVHDGQGGRMQGTATLTVRPVNDAPVASGEAFATDEDVALVLDAPGVLQNDTDVDGDALTAELTEAPEHGDLTLASDGSLSYAPAADFFGTDQFTYTVHDGQGETRTAEAFIEIRPVNDPPKGRDADLRTDEDVPLSMPAPGALTGASDVDGDVLQAFLAEPPEHGTAHVDADGAFTYTPEPDFHGPDQFAVEVRDAQGGVGHALLRIDVRPMPDAPVAGADAYSVREDETLTLAAPGVLGNDSDIDGDALTASIVTLPQHGTLELMSDGRLTYTPEANYHGPDAFTYAASDGSQTADALVSLSVTPVNDAPLAVDDAWSSAEDEILHVASPGPLQNDGDVDGDVLRLRIDSPPAHGTLQVSEAGDFTYVPEPDFHGDDAFTYFADDGQGGQSRGQVSLRVEPRPDAPRAKADAYVVAEDSPLRVAAPGPLANDVDVDLDSLHARLHEPPGHGSLTLESNGALHYVPDPDWNGTDRFGYFAVDATGLRDSTVVEIRVTAVNDAPRGRDDRFELEEDRPLAVTSPGVLGNDTDVDDDRLQARLSSPPAQGQLELQADGSFLYSPAADFFGTALFEYTVTDGQGGTATATVSLVVSPVNDAPRAFPDSYTVFEDDTLTVAAPGLLANDVEVEAEPMQARVEQPPARGSVSVSPDGSFTYVPDRDFAGSDTFTYAVRDPHGATQSGQVLLRVQPLNDAPRAAPDSFVVLAGSPFLSPVAAVVANDFDADGDTLHVQLDLPPQNGELDLLPDGTFRYTAAAGFTGPDAFTYVVSDGLLQHRARVSLFVEGLGVTYRGSTKGVASQSETVHTLSSLPAVQGDLYLAAVSSRPFQRVSGITGMDLDWVFLQAQHDAAGEVGVEVWMARGIPHPGPVTARFENAVETGGLAVTRYSGVDPADPIGSVTFAASPAPGGAYDVPLTTLTQGGIVHRAVTLLGPEHRIRDVSFRRTHVVAGDAEPAPILAIDDRAVDAGTHALRGDCGAATSWSLVALEIRSNRIDATLPLASRLQITPNPAGPRALIGYTLYRRAHVELQIFDARGRLVRPLLDAALPPGRMQLEWDSCDARGRRVDSGVYFLRLRSEGRTTTRKVVVIR